MSSDLLEDASKWSGLAKYPHTINTVWQEEVVQTIRFQVHWTIRALVSNQYLLNSNDVIDFNFGNYMHKYHCNVFSSKFIVK